MPAASGGVSWKPKAPEQKGFVWQQVALLDIADPPEKAKAKMEAIGYQVLGAWLSPSHDRLYTTLWQAMVFHWKTGHCDDAAHKLSHTAHSEK